MNVVKTTTMKIVEIKRIALAAVCAATLSVVGSSPATAEEPPAAMNTVEPNTVGLGAGATFGGLETGLSSLGAVPVSIAVPIRLGATWRLEPRIKARYFDSERDVEHQDDGAGEGPNRHEQTNFNLEVSADLQHLWPVGEQTLAYAGARVGTRRTWGDTDYSGGLGGLSGNSDSEQLDLLAGPVLGGEYLFSQTFSVGVEAALLYSYDYHNYDAENASETLDVEHTNQSVRTFASIFVRMYLW